jgi:hypothetical protein
MSSVTSFIRQVPVSTTYYSGVGASLYTFTPAASNYVGNYPPGTMAAAAVQVPATGVLRDLGKTIFADLSGSVVPFRHVQVIDPVSFPANFGVYGSSTAPGAYNNLYIPVTVAGIGLGPAPAPIAGGQM